MKRLFVIAAAATALLAQAQTFPGSKPITIVVPFAAGGPTDLVARQLAETMRKTMGGGANFVVENSVVLKGANPGQAIRFEPEPSRFEPISEDKWKHIYTVSGVEFGGTDPFGCGH